jgi:hypothetical protein
MADPPIVINGGSITISFPEGIFTSQTSQPGAYSNEDKEITRIEITGSGIDNYDNTAKGGDIVVTIHYADK